jgi:hypothetical protein
VKIKTFQYQSPYHHSILQSMNFANPHFFSAILDGIDHRFILIQESESVLGATGALVGAPRFSVGAINATRDPRFVGNGELVEVGVTNTALNIPQGMS